MTSVNILKNSTDSRNVLDTYPSMFNTGVSGSATLLIYILLALKVIQIKNKF